MAINNRAERDAEHTRERLVIDELLAAADEAQKTLRVVAERSGGITGGMAAEIHRVEQRLWNSLHPEARR